MLTERQKQIIKDLEMTQIPITADALSKKYEVSLRTIRNDINDIAEELKTMDCTFQRTPHVGMQIISKHQITQQVSMKMVDYLSLESKNREHLILLCFLLKTNPITIEYLASLFLVSKGTIVNDIRMIQAHSGIYDVKLQGIRNKGYFLEGSSKQVIRFINICMNNTNISLLQSYFLDQSAFFSYTDIELINEAIHYIDTHLLWKIVNRDSFFVWLAMYLKYYQLKEHREDTLLNRIDESTKLQQLIIYIEYHFHLLLDHVAISALKHILSLYTDFTEDINDLKISEDLSNAVDLLLKDLARRLPALQDDLDNLHMDITRHLLCSANRRNLNLENDNPLVHKIKVRYLELWNQVDQAKIMFETVYPMLLDDNEIGFITLYVARSLEKYEKIKEARVLVVCNTGRGVSKLLVTRIMNHLPEIHIVALQSYVSLQENAELLKQIDLVITTIPLPELSKPYVVVSPFLTDLELARVKEAVWISCQNYVAVYQQDMNLIVDSVVNKYVSVQQARELTGEIQDLMGKSSSLQLSSTYIDSELYAQIAVETIAFMKRISSLSVKTFSYEILSGIMAHVIMSIPRWMRGDFIKVSDFVELKALYPKEFQLILEFINQTERVLSVFIDQNEVIAILRYLLI